MGKNPADEYAHRKETKKHKSRLSRATTPPYPRNGRWTSSTDSSRFPRRLRRN